MVQRTALSVRQAEAGNVVPRLALTCRDWPYRALPCRAPPRHAWPSHAPPSLALIQSLSGLYTVPCPASQCPVLPRLAPPCLATPYLARPNRAAPRPALPSRAQPGHAWPCLALILGTQVPIMAPPAVIGHESSYACFVFSPASRTVGLLAITTVSPRFRIDCLTSFLCVSCSLSFTCMFHSLALPRLTLPRQAWPRHALQCPA